MKKRLPLTLIQSLSPIYEKNSDILEQIKPDEKYLFHVKDKDPESDFFFEITKQLNNTAETNYEYSLRPNSRDRIVTGKGNGSLKGIIQNFESWITIIREYNDVVWIFDEDPILQSYEEYFTEKFTIVDEDADTAPFNLDNQLLLDEFLTRAEAKIEAFKENRTEKEVKQLDELKSIVAELRKNITRLSKKKFVKGFTKFLAKTQKFSLELLKGVFVEASKEITKALIGGAIN